MVEVAREHGLVVFSDEIYDKILYDEAKHTSIASLADDVFFVTFGAICLFPEGFIHMFVNILRLYCFLVFFSLRFIEFHKICKLS